MTTASPSGRNQLDRAGQRPVRWLPGLVEAAASLVALCAMAALLINKVDTMVAFFGETPTVTPANVTSYHRGLAVLAVAVAVSFGAATWRRSSPTGRATYWHGLVLMAGLLSAAAFHVTVRPPVPDPVPVQDRSGTVCHSGGDSAECVGG